MAAWPTITLTDEQVQRANDALYQLELMAPLAVMEALHALGPADMRVVHAVCAAILLDDLAHLYVIEPREDIYTETPDANDGDREEAYGEWANARAPKLMALLTLVSHGTDEEYARASAAWGNFLANLTGEERAALDALGDRFDSEQDRSQLQARVASMITGEFTIYLRTLFDAGVFDGALENVDDIDAVAGEALNARQAEWTATCGVDPFLGAIRRVTPPEVLATYDAAYAEMIGGSYDD